MNTSKERGRVSGRAIKPFVMDAAMVTEYLGLHALGINLTDRDVRQMQDEGRKAGFAMDDAQGTMFPSFGGTPVQFLQNWLPGFVRVVTAARNIDRLTGISVSGSWDDEEIVQGVLEPTGHAVPYGDYTNIPLASWNPSYERRTVVRLEQGMRVGALEEARSARMNVNTAAEKRASATLSLELSRNRIGFYGFNSGVNRTYGFLNDPSLPAYVSAPNGAGGTSTWATKTFLEITADIRGMVGRLASLSKGAIDTNRTQMTLALPTGVAVYLSVTSDFGNSVQDWLTKTYPNIRVETAPELDLANGGANVAYLYADSVEDGATDDSRTWLQLVPAKFQLLGVEKQAKAYVEDYVSATAGVMLKRPYAITRLTGI